MPKSKVPKKDYSKDKEVVSEKRIRDIKSYSRNGKNKFNFKNYKE